MTVVMRSGVAAGLASAAVALTVGLPAPRALLPLWSVAFALPAAPLVFAAVARRLPRPCWAGARRLLAAALVLVPYASLEEVFWRGLVLGASARALTLLGAVAISSVGFGYVHRSRRHVASGAAFGALYVVTGSLAAPVAAHGLYNLVVWSDRRRRGTATGLERGDVPVELRGVSKRYRESLALDEVDLELREGELVALLGPNGAGKTTAVSILLGLRRPDSGRALLFGRDPRQPGARRALGAMPQELDLPPTLTVREILQLVAAHYPDRRSPDEVLERHGLGGVAARQGGGLSGGERRRVAAAIAFVGNPRLLVLDEPGAALDTGARRRLREEIAEHRERGGAVLLTTHDLDEAAALADRVVVLARGRVVAAGTVEEIRSRLTTARVTLRTSRLPALAHALRVERCRGTVRLETDDPAALLRELVARDVPLDGIEVRQPTLEEAVAALAQKAEA